MSSRLIKNFTAASDNLRPPPPENVHKMCQCTLLFLHLHCSFLLLSSMRVLWPSLGLNELSLIIMGISGAEFDSGAAPFSRHCGGGSSSCLKWVWSACKSWSLLSWGHNVLFHIFSLISFGVSSLDLPDIANLWVYHNCPVPQVHLCLDDKSSPSACF